MDQPTRRLAGDNEDTRQVVDICPECQGAMLPAAVGTYSLMAIFVMRTFGRFKRIAMSEVNARVCTRCGYTKLYATEPKKLLEG